MISKEERAELRELVASVTLPLPWKSDSDGVIVSDLYDFVADCDGTGGDFIDPKPAKLIAGAVNALPKTLDALDAADERIAELEAAAQWRKMADAPRDGAWIIAETNKDAMADLSRPMCRYMIIKSVHRGWVTTENTLVDTFLFARWLPIPGDGQ